MVSKENIYGAMAAGLIDGAIEFPVAYEPEKYTGKWPYVPTIEPLPPVDDWIVLGIPGLAWVFGKWVVKRRELEDFGWGGLLYAGPMFLHHIIVRSAWMLKKTAAAAVYAPSASYVPASPAPAPATVGPKPKVY